MRGWEEKRLGELYDIPSSNGLSRPSAVRGEGYKMVNMGELFSNNIICDIPMERVKMSDKEKQKFLLNEGDLLFARQSLVASGAGKCSIIKSLKEEITFESHLIRVRLNKEIANSWYYYYLFQLPYNPVKTIVNQCAQAGIRGNELVKIKVPFPNKEIQDKIADILATYDNLIENNNRRIKLLEHMAEELYKEWFVRFRFPGHENAEFEDGIPKGWERNRLFEMIEFNPTIRAPKQDKFKIIPMAALSTSAMVLDDSQFDTSDSLFGSRSQNGDTLLARITPCLENGKTGFVHNLLPLEVAGGSTEFIVMRSKLLNPYLVYFIARDKSFRDYAIGSMNGADGRQRARVDCIERLWWLLPPQHLIDYFEEIVKPYFEFIYSLNEQNAKLRCQRDLLLPRLMSGKLEV